MTTYQEIHDRAWNECRLLNVVLELTQLCNYDCFYCYNDRSRRTTPLSFEEYSDFLSQLAEMAVLNLTLTGGEPLVHPDFFAIGSRARELGFVIRVKSNGHLIRGEVAKRLREEVAPYQVDLSVHGATAATHDRQTRHPGSFDRLMENIDEMLQVGLRLKLNCTLTSWNEHEIEDIFKLADRLGLKLNFNSSVSPKDDGNTDPLQISPSLEGLANLARIYEERQARARARSTDTEGTAPPSSERPVVKRQCGAGSSSLAVDEWGNVMPCVQWRRAVGNIRQAPIAEIWASSEELQRVQAITVEAKKVAAQFEVAKGMAPFCPGIAELREGDPLAIYTLEPPE